MRSYRESFAGRLSDCFHPRSLDLIHTLANSRSRMVSLCFKASRQTKALTWLVDHLRHITEGRVRTPISRVNTEHSMAVQFSAFFKRAQSIFSSKSRATWIELDILSFSAVSSMVSKSLHRSKEECAPLSRLVHSVSRGNAFSARSFLVTLQRQRLVSPPSPSRYS